MNWKSRFSFCDAEPIELEGKYPLQRAQIDRFMFHIVIDHPPEDEELKSFVQRR
ncbi:MAG: hypothetical protein Ct9H300mP25_00350 [Acidobacteriota bacterium]|nr:MAG: hypothetical protein Ct9H300mP25_00350 [Acidobacteriota bacterium]